MRATTPPRRTAPDARDAAFTAWLEARQPALLRTAYLICGDRHTAEDVLQTALAKLYLAWDRVHERQATDAYVRRIIARENASLWRRAWKRREHATDVLPEPAGATDRHDDGLGDEVWALVRGLPPRARAVVVLRYYEHLTEAETAEVLGISVGTVKSQCSRAVAALRERTPDSLHPRHLEDGR